MIIGIGPNGVCNPGQLYGVPGILIGVMMLLDEPPGFAREPLLGGLEVSVRRTTSSVKFELAA